MSRPPRWILTLARIALVVLVVWAIFRAVGLDLARIDRQELARWSPSPGLLLLASTLLLGVYLGHALLWRRIVSDLGVGRPRLSATVRVFFLANLGRYLPGRIWQIAGMAYLGRQAGLTAMGATAAAALGQLTFLITGAAFLTLLLPGWAGPLPVIVASALLASLAGAVLWLRVSPRARRLRAWTRARLGRPAADALGLVGRIRPRKALAWVLAYGATWALLGVAFVLFVTAFVPEAAGEARHLAGALAASYLTGYIAIFAPGGIGVREAVMTVLLDQVVPTSAALLIAVASRIWFTAVELLPVAAIPLLPPADARERGPAP